MLCLVIDFKIKILVFTLLIFNVLNGFAQTHQEESTEKSSMRPIHILRNARIAERSGDIFTAIDYYLIYNELKPDRLKIVNKLGLLLHKEKNYPKAKEFLLSSYNADPDRYLINLFYYAQCLHSLAEYDKATKYYELFIEKGRINQELREYVRLARDFADKLKEIQGYKETPLDVIINLLDTTINKPHLEFSPIPYMDNKLIYGSLKEDNLNYYNPLKDELPVRKLYLAENIDGNWKLSGEFDTVINHNKINIGSGAFSHDKKRFYFSRCEKDYNHNNYCKIYVSHLENNEWQEPEALPEIINKPFTINTMPTMGVSRNGTDMLYFVSDRNDGIGGMDIWFSFYDDRKEEWREPRNCGRKINTIGDEITPYYNIETKTLYFSSDGHPGFGGFDVFKSTGEARNWKDVINIGNPINTSYDEQYYILNDDRSRGFFTSNRPEGYSVRHKYCCDDIYEFFYEDYINIAVTGKVFGISDSVFLNSISKQYNKNVSLNIDVDKEKDELEVLYNHPVRLFITDDEAEEDFFIRVDYTKPDFYFYNLEPEKLYYLSVRDCNNIEIRTYFSTRKISLSDTIFLKPIIVNTIPDEPITIEDIYYEFGSARLTQNARSIIRNTIYKIMKDYDNIIVEIAAHTDSIGSKEDNLILSQNRAQNVVDFLIRQGIDARRLRAKGYGEDYPVAPNTNSDGTDNPEGRALNRRTEIRIIGFIEEDSMGPL